MLFKKRASKSIALALVGIMADIPFLNSVSAMENLDYSKSSFLNEESKKDFANLNLDNEKVSILKSLMNKGVFKEFDFNERGVLSLKNNIESISLTYKLSTDETYVINSIIDESSNINFKDDNRIYNMNTWLHVKNWKIYFTYNDIVSFLLAAAQVGPAALAAALVGISSILGTAGPVISTIMSILGVASLSNLYYLIIQANVKKRGIYIGIDWSNGFPNYTQGLWR